MNPRITSIENTIARDPPRATAAGSQAGLASGGRNIFGLLVADQLRLAAQSLRLARRVAIVSGFYVSRAGAGETDGPPGAKVLGEALTQLGIEVSYITDRWNAPLFEALGLNPVLDVSTYLEDAQPTHLVSIERVGRAADGRYRNMRGDDITETTAPLDELFIEGGRRGLTTIGIGDGGNEIGMGKVFADTMANIAHGPKIACVIPTDFCITAGVSNWGAYGLAGALSVLQGRDLLPTAEAAARDIEQVVKLAGAVDGVTCRHTATVDGLDLAHSLRMLENIRRQIAPSPFKSRESRNEPISVGVLGYGQTGRATAALLSHRGHRVRVSDQGCVTVDGKTQLAGVETGGHTVAFLEECDLVVASPGVSADAPIRNELHRRGIPVVSELELADQLCDRALIAVTGTVGKRTTVETMQRIFQQGGRPLTIGGNRGRPLSELLLDEDATDPIALAVSSFQLETVVRFQPAVAVVLNINEAHLDRHRSIPEYVRIKSRVFMNQHADDVLILSFDDPIVRALARKHQGRTLFVSGHQPVDRGAWMQDGRVFVNLEGAVEPIGPADPRYPENLLSAVLVARLYGLPAARIAEAISFDIRDS